MCRDLQTRGRAYLDDVVSGAGDMQTIQVYSKQDAAANDDSPKKIDETASASKSGVKTLSSNDRKKIEKIDLIIDFYFIYHFYFLKFVYL